MATLFNYGTLDPVPFKVTKDAVAVTGITFSTNDVQVSLAGATFVDVSTAITEIGKGWYLYTPPNATYTEVEWFILNVDEVAGTNFDENGIICYTGGNASARFSG